MSAPDIEDPAQLPSRLRTFLPLIYVAWADGDLSDQEIEEICAAIAPHLDSDCQAGLGRWLDPERPPSAVELRAMLTTIERAAAGWGADEKVSLHELGKRLARADGHEPTSAELEALDRLAGALGVVSDEAARRLVGDGVAAGEEEEEAPLDVGSLRRFLDEPYGELRRELRRLLSTDEFAYRYDLSTAEERERVLGWCHRLADEGYGALGFPRRFGGGDDPGAFLAAFETLAGHDLSLVVKFGVQFGLFAGSLHQLGTERHHERYLERASTLALPGCFAMTETGHGSNVAELETVATFDRESDTFVLHSPTPSARKDYIGNAAAHGRCATVFAQLEIDGVGYGVHAFVVPIRDDDGAALPGIEITDCGRKLGLNGVDNGRLMFDHVRVPRENLLDRFAQVDADGNYTSPIASPSKRFFTMLGTLVGGRVSVASAGLAATRSAMTIAVRYAERRRQFGPAGGAETTLLDYTTHQLRLLPRLATTYALHFALRDLAQRYLDANEDRRELEGLAAGLKAVATWHATDTIQACREACGGQGYLAENRFASLKADTDVFTTFEGDNTVLMQLLAKGLLTAYRKQFGDMSFLDMLRFAAARAGATVAELNPIVTRNTAPEHLRSADFLEEALTWREQHLLSTLGRRLRSRIQKGVDSFTALVECQDHAVSLARAHVERHVHTQFRHGLAEAGDPAIVASLEKLATLFALHRIEADRGWFQEHGYLESGKAKAVRREVRRLCREIRPGAADLVAGFGIPRELLGAPIAE